MDPRQESRAPIYIVLTTFDGSAHLREQIASLRGQSHTHWRLLIRDDGSTDDTVGLIQELAREDDRIEFLPDEPLHLGVTESFSLLLGHALERGADWIAICDQDDVWVPEKLTLQLAKRVELEAGTTEPFLLHSDLSVVGPSLQPIHRSLHQYMALHHEETTPLETLLLQNFVTGCSCMVNRPLLEVALPIPSEAVMHDWWLALCAAACGSIGFSPEATLLYRQHDSNQIGARAHSRRLMELVGRILSLRPPSHDDLIDTLRQVSALRDRLARSVDAGVASTTICRAHEFVCEYIALYDEGVSRLHRVRELQRRRISRQDPILDAVFKLKLLMLPVEWPDRRSP